jgi:hypothetical protein
MNITTNHVYAAFNQQIDRSRAWLLAKMRNACGYKADVLVDRLTQRIVEIGLAPYAIVVHERLQKKTEMVPPPEKRINCGKAIMHVGSGQIAIPPRQLLASELEFLIHWFYTLLTIISGAFFRKDTPAATLVVDLTDENLFSGGRDDRFIEYCRSGPIAALRDAKRFLIAPTNHSGAVKSLTRSISSDPAVYGYCRHPLMTLLREARLGFPGRLRLVIRHVFLFLEYHYAVLRVPVLSLISREFAYGSIAFELDRRAQIQSIILTCSSCACQPLWVRSLRHAQVHMIWYSQNWKPASYRSDGLSSDLPALRWIRVDSHWVWTKAFAKYLIGLGHGDTKIHVVGPIVWYLPQAGHRNRNEIRILAFDVPAVTDKMMLEMVGEISNYYHPDNLRSFVSDIVALKPALNEALMSPVAVHLKRKRGMRPHYAKEYFDYIDTLSDQGVLCQAGSADNLYSLISRSHLVIAYPFTSAATIAESLGVPAIYYDPTQSIVRDDFCDSHAAVRFASSPQELLSTSIDMLRQAVRTGSGRSDDESRPVREFIR